MIFILCRKCKNLRDLKSPTPQVIETLRVHLKYKISFDSQTIGGHKFQTLLTKEVILPCTSSKLNGGSSSLVMSPCKLGVKACEIMHGQKALSKRSDYFIILFPLFVKLRPRAVIQIHTFSRAEGIYQRIGYSSLTLGRCEHSALRFWSNWVECWRWQRSWKNGIRTLKWDWCG